MQASRTGRILMAVLLAAFAACSDDTTDTSSVTEFSADLNGAKERPSAVTTPGNGTATFEYAGGNIEFTVTYSGLRGTPTASHIHLGGPTQAGGVVVNLCGAGGTVPWPVACPSTKAGTFTGTAGAANLVGGASTTMESVLAAMRSFNAYINVHTDTVGGGEIRGNVVGVP